MQENNNQVQQPTENKNNKNNLLVIVGIVVALIAVILVVVLVIKPGNDGQGGGGTTNNPEVQKIALKGSIVEKDKVLIEVNNTKVDTYDVVFELTVYNENKEIVRVFEETVHAVSPKKITYYVVDTTAVLQSNYTYDIKVKEEIKKDASKIFNDKITQQNNKTSDAIEVELRNKSNEMIDSVQIAIVYYNAKEVVSYTSQFISDFPANAAILETVYIPTDETGNTIKFDNHEVIITAYNHEK